MYVIFWQNSSSWVLLNVASLYWRVQGDTVEAIKCLRQALYFSPSNARVGIFLVYFNKTSKDVLAHNVLW